MHKVVQKLWKVCVQPLVFYTIFFIKNFLVFKFNAFSNIFNQVLHKISNLINYFFNLFLFVFTQFPHNLLLKLLIY